MNKRITYVDICKALGIYLVVLDHIMPNTPKLRAIIGAFHMPLFFILSGYTTSIKKSYKEYCLSRIKSLIIPYFIWAILFSTYSIKNLLYILYGSNKSLGVAGSNAVLWFLPCLFISDLLANAILRICGNCKNILIPIVLSLFSLGYELKMLHTFNYGYPWSFDIALVGCGFVLFGYLLRHLIDNSNKLNQYIYIYI